MGLITCPYHGPRLMLHMCAHLQSTGESLKQHAVTFSLLEDSTVYDTSYLCPACREELQLNTQEVHSGEQWEAMASLANVYVCKECMKLRLE